MTIKKENGCKVLVLLNLTLEDTTQGKILSITGVLQYQNRSKSIFKAEKCLKVWTWNKKLSK
jgi:hypothetical protein